MTAVAVTSANTNALRGVGRTVVRAKKNWAKLPNDYTLPRSNGRSTALSSTRLAVAYTSGYLQTFDFDGSTWSTVGNELNITSLAIPTEICALSSSRVAIRFDGSLATFDFDGTNWTQVGNALTGITACNGPDGLTALSGTRVVSLAQGSCIAYDFNGTSWSVHSSIYISGQTIKGITALSATRVALSTHWNDDRLYIFDLSGSTWSQFGSYTLIGSYFYHLQTLDSTTIIGQINWFEILVFEYNGTSWSKRDVGFSNNFDSYYRHFAVLSSDKIVVSYNTLEVYEHGTFYTPYIVSEDTTDGGIEVWKGNSDTPLTFSEQHSSGNPASAGRYGSAACALDSNGIIHIVYMDDNGTAPSVRYVTFNTNTDTFSGDVAIIADLGGDMVSIANMTCAIAIDANDIPHIVYTGYPAVMGTNYYTLYYNNRISSAWNTSNIEIIGGIAGEHAYTPNITIGLDNIPIISTSHHVNGNATLYYSCFIGNAYDATSFTEYEFSRTESSGQTYYPSSLSVDSSGNVYVGILSYLYKHNYGDNWSTWQSELSANGSKTNQNLIIDGTKIYVLYENLTSHDICYNKYTGAWGSGSWSGETVLETGTFNTVKAKWGFWVDNGKGGSLRKTEVTYSFDGLSSISGFLIEGTKYTGTGKKMIGVSFEYYGAGVPGTVYAKIYSLSGGLPGTLLATSLGINNTSLSGTLTWVYLHFDKNNQITLQNGVDYAIILDAPNPIKGYQNESGYPYYYYSSGIWYVGALAVHISLKVHSLIEGSSPTEIDYVFMDETSTPDVWFNSLSLAAWATKSLKVYTGGSWVAKPLKSYVAGSWVVKPLKSRL